MSTCGESVGSTATLSYRIPSQSVIAIAIELHNTPGHSRVLYHGGLLGDIMWTLQPFAILGSAAIRAYLEETLATGAPAFRIKRPLPAAAAGRKRTKSGSSGAASAKPTAAPVGSDSASTLTRRAKAVVDAAPEATAAAAVKQSPVRKASSSASASAASSSSSPVTAPTTPAQKKRRGGGWSPLASIASRTRASQRGGKKD